jgi:PKD repeat protein
MKKFLLSSLLFILALVSEAQIIVTGEITTNTTWNNDNIYILNGWVYVRAGATLTIEPGTVIKGDFISKGALIIERDADIIADGTMEQPIVFTSQKAAGQRSYGDWGGLIICGRASVNAPANAGSGTEAGEAIIEGGVGSIYGGGANPDDDDNSGILRYVRIEFGGIPFQPNSEINGLTMGGVGRSTIIENVQVSYCGDDAFEWFGGTVDCKNLIAYRNWDDDFDTDFGYTGHVQFGLSVRDPAIADQSGSNGFESDNDGSGTGATPITNGKFSNMTVVGPLVFSDSPNSNYKRALHLRRNTRTSIFNSVFVGYPTGLLIDGGTTHTNAMNNDLRFKNNYLVAMVDTLATTSNPNPNNITGAFDISTWFVNGANQTLDMAETVMWNNLNLNTPDLTWVSGSPLASGASFSDDYLNNAFFETVDFIGAFGQDNWAQCWTSWDPQNEVYAGSVDNTILASVAPVGVSELMMCPGTSISLQATCNHPNAMYAWSNNVNDAATTIEQPGSYTVLVSTANGCSVLLADIVVANYMTEQVAILADGPTSFCTGGSVVLASSQANGNLWSEGSTAASIVISNSGTYSVEHTDANGCVTTSNTIDVSVSDSPVPTIAANGALSFCEGENLTLTSSIGESYQWNLNGVMIEGANDNVLIVDEEGVYTVTVTNQDACLGVGTSGFVFAQVIETPSADFDYSADFGSLEYQFSNNSTGAEAYFWDFGNGSTSSEINPTISFTEAGANTVTLTAINGDCVNTFEMTISDVTVSENGIFSTFKVFPNPVQDEFTVLCQEFEGFGVVRIYAINGQLIEERWMNFNDTEVVKMSGLNWNDGLYVVAIVTDKLQTKSLITVSH